MKTYLNIDAIPDGAIPSTKLSSGGSGGSGGGAYREVLHGTNDTTFTLTPNTFHVWDEISTLDVSLGAETTGMANEYLFQFTSGSEPTTLILPDDIKWANELVIEPHMIYQISILKGLASVLAFDNVPLITFYVDGVEYKAEDGMTWEEWVNSEYNIAGFYIDYMDWIDTYVIAIGDGLDYGTIPESSLSGLISSGYEYTIYYENGVGPI